MSLLDQIKRRQALPTKFMTPEIEYKARDWEALKKAMQMIVPTSEAGPEPEMFLPSGRLNPLWEKWARDPRRIDPTGGMVKSVGKRIVKNIPFQEYVYKYGLDDVIRNYTFDTFLPINTKLRRGEKLSPNEKNILDIFKVPGDYEGTLYRGTWLDNNTLNSLEEGNILRNKTILSTTPDRSTAEHFIDQRIELSPRRTKEFSPVVYKFSNSHNKGYDISPFNVYGESEVLLKPESTFRVSGIEEYLPGIKQINLEDIHPEVIKLIEKNYGSSIKPILGIGGMLLMEDMEPFND